MTIDQQTILDRKAEGYELLNLSVDGTKVLVFYKQNWIDQPQNEFRTNHAEYYSHYVSETGYRSHFFYPDELDNYQDAKDYLTQFAKQLHKELLVRKPATIKVAVNTNQQGLF